MSQTLLETPTELQRQHSAARTVTIAVMVVALLVSAVTRDWARDAREKANRGSSPINTNGRTTISGMNSFTLALLLGGLRGPLVLMLWTSSESQKIDKNLDDFDTKVELIRLLQPEFDTVHIFQVWNKAYNISVQMSSLFNKYTTILDAIDYGQNVLKANPDNLNMLEAVGDVYFNKFGNSAEKQYYRALVRRESLPHKMHQKLDRNDPGWRRLELDPIVDAGGTILPEKLRATRERPAGLTADQPFNNGSELQYLEPFQPYKYGVSPIAIAYNDYMMAQTLQRVTHAKHAQLSDQVVDSRPSITLKFWAEEEQEIGRRAEQKAFNVTLPATAERLELEIPAAGVPLTQKPVEPDKVTEAIYDYDRAAQIAIAARAEYQKHLELYKGNFFTYQSHLEGLVATEHFSKADAAYLRAMNTTGDERAKQIEIAKTEYQLTIIVYEKILLRYYTDDGLLNSVLPNIPKEQYDRLGPEVIHEATMKIQAEVLQGAPDSHGDDRAEYFTYFQRCSMRLQSLVAAH